MKVYKVAIRLLPYSANVAKQYLGNRKTRLSLNGRPGWFLIGFVFDDFVEQWQ